MKRQVLDKCTAWLNYLLTLSPDLESYCLGYVRDTRKWVFMFRLQDGKSYSYELSEQEIGHDTYEKFREDLKGIFR